MTRTFDSGAPGTPVANGLQLETSSALPAGHPALLTALVSLGVRMTSQRRLIIGLIQGQIQGLNQAPDAGAPLDAATLLGLARQRDSSVDRATVYRTLALLRKNGLMQGPRQVRVESERHAHAGPDHDDCKLNCCRCGAVEELAPRALDRPKRVIARRHGFETSVTRLDIRGLCSACCRASRGRRQRAKQALQGRTRRT